MGRSKHKCPRSLSIFLEINSLGSGKTWTMFGSDIQNQDLQGIIPRAAS